LAQQGHEIALDKAFFVRPNLLAGSGCFHSFSAAIRILAVTSPTEVLLSLYYYNILNIHCMSTVLKKFILMMSKDAFLFLGVLYMIYLN
jgi:hypothetical protein